MSKYDIERELSNNLNTRKNLIDVMLLYADEQNDRQELFMLLQNLNQESVYLESILSKIDSKEYYLADQYEALHENRGEVNKNDNLR